MKRDIIIIHHQIGLKIISAWPGGARLPGLHFSVGILLFFLIFQSWNMIVVYRDLELLTENLVVTVGVVSNLLKLLTFCLKRR